MRNKEIIIVLYYKRGIRKENFWQEGDKKEI
jgi:hypothetical protein